MCNAPAATDADGRVLISWRSRTPSMEIDFAEPLGLRRRLQVEQGKRTSIVLLGEASSGQSFRLVSSTNGNGLSAPKEPTPHARYVYTLTRAMHVAW